MKRNIKKIILFIMVLFNLLIKYNVVYADKIEFCNESTVQENEINFKNLTVNDGLSSNLITDIYQDSIGYIWIGTEDGLNQYNGNMLVKYSYENNTENSIASPHITSINEDRHKNIWGGTDYGLNIINRDRDKIIRIGAEEGKDSELSNGDITTIYRDSNDTMWIGTKYGLNKYNEVNNRFIKYYSDGSNSSITNNYITDLQEDDFGYLWISTIDGIAVMNLNTNSIYNSKNENDKLEYVYEIDKNCKGEIWISAKSGIFKVINIDYETGSFNVDIRIETESYNNVTQLLHKSNGYMWLSEGNGLIRYIISSNKIKIYNAAPNYLLSNSITCLYEDRSGVLWVGTNKGISILNIEQQFSNTINNILNKYGIYESSITTFWEDDNNDLRIGTDENGLIKFDISENDMVRFVFDENDIYSLLSNKIKCILEGRNNNIIILTKFNIKEESFINYYEQDGLANDYINSIIIDNSENIWIGTSDGLSKFIINENRFVRFTEVDGLCGNQFNKRAAYKTKSGQLLFGTTKGVVSFNPDNIEEISVKEDKVVLDSLWINKKLVINDGEEMELNYNENNISISYFLPDYTKIGVITYLYKMDGVNEEWNVGSTEGYTIYTMLKPGKYTFRVKAVNSDGSFTEESTIPFIIKKPFWRSSIAYCIYISLALIITIFILYRVKFMKRLIDNQTKEINRQLEENKRLYERNIRNEKFKNDYFVNLSHELRTPLNIILSVLQLLNSLEEKGNITREKALYYIDVIKKSSNSLLSIINDIIDSSKIESGAYKISKQENIDIVYLVEETALNMSEYINNKGIELIIDPEIEELPICCDSKEIERCVVNLIGNAVKFTEKDGKIKVLIKEQDNTVSISIEDNGLGISKDDQEFIFKRFEQGGNVNSTKVSSSGIGLTLVKYIVELHGGHVELESELGKGSKFTLVLPIN